MNWVVEELLDADFGDFRLSDRVIQLVEKLSQRRLNGVTAAQAALPCDSRTDILV